jgi:hypothetical protein
VEDPGDLAKQRLSLLAERDQARRDIARGVLVLLSMIPVVTMIPLVTMLTDDVQLLVATVYVGLSIVIGARLIARGLGRHLPASFKLRQLHARNTGMPSVRVIKR